MEITTAQEIADQIGSKFVTATLVQTFIALSKPVRLALKDFFSSVEITISAARAQALLFLGRGDIFANKLSVLSSALDQLLLPVDNMLRSVPLDSIAKESPEITSLMQRIADSIPLKIPTTIATTVAGFSGLDFFDGINSYQDLRDKLDDLEFRLARATSLSNYSSTGLAYLDSKLDEVRSYINLLNILNA